MAAVNGWRLTGTTGGGADDLDGINGNNLTTGDIAIVDESGVHSYYELLADSTAESDPWYIVPDTNPGSFCWHLRSSNIRWKWYPSGTTYTITAQQALMDTIFLNTNQTSQLTFTLPEGDSTTDYRVTFFVIEPYYLKVSCYSGQQIRYGATTTAASGYIRIDDEGAAVSLTWTGDYWDAMFHNDIAWNYDV